MAALGGGVALIGFMLIEESRFPAAYSWPMLWVSIGVSMTVGSALSLVSFVLTRGTGRLDRVIRRITAVAIGVSACVLAAFICDEEAIGQWFIAFPISLLVTGVGFLASAALGGLAEIRDRETGAVKCDLWIRCPRCSKEQKLATGESRCSGCRMVFHIEVKEPICPKCGYNVHLLTRPVCPECGEQLSPQLAPTVASTMPGAVAASAS
jgi:transposase-like protein